MATRTYQSRGTGYYPDPSPLEGGFKDRCGKPLQTLQDFLNGQADYVSVAMDKDLEIPYGTRVTIPEIESSYKKRIDFRVVDTGSAFTGKGYTRIDICTADRTASVDPAINRMLTLRFAK